ncbi:hypothetical protein GGF31_003454 [Allomyces arbusculus]|nr:hypothetical protein GGF31_003454 [Allomyces arbusculus]
MSPLQSFLRSIHLTKDEINVMHRNISLFIDAQQIPFDNKHNVVEQRLADGIVFYTYRYFQELDQKKIKPFDIYYINGNMDIQTLTNMIQMFSPNLFIRRPNEPAKSVSDNVGFDIVVDQRVQLA